jgi:hypothetical protein
MQAARQNNGDNTAGDGETKCFLETLDLIEFLL